MPNLYGPSGSLRNAARWLADHELWLLAAATPFLLFPNRWTPLVFLLVPCIWLSRRVVAGRFTVPTPLDLPIAILAAMAVVGYDVSVDPTMSWAKFWGILFQVTLFYGVVNGARDEKSIHRIVALFLLVTLSVALLGLVGSDWDAVRLLELPWLYGALPRLKLGLPGSGVPRPSSSFHPREVGATMAMLLPVPLALTAFGRHSGLRWLSAAALLIVVPVLLLSQSIQALFGCLLALLVIAVWWRRWCLLAIPVGLAAVAAAVWAAGPRSLALALLSFDHPIGVGVLLRLDMWSRALAMIRDMPFTGVGLNTFPIMQSQFYPGYALGPNEVFAHNQFLQTAVDLGLPGLAGFIWLFVAFYVMLFRTLRRPLARDLEAALVGIGAGALAYLGNGLVDCVTLGAKPLAALWAMLGIAVAISNSAASRAVLVAEDAASAIQATPASTGQRAGPPRSWSWLLAPSAFVAALVLVALAAPGVTHRNLGVLRAHRALMTARTGAVADPALNAAEASLRQALAHDPHQVSVLRHLAIVQAWLVEYDEALARFDAAVALDGQAPYARYAPFEVWRRRLQGQPPPDRYRALVKVYTHWINRYPGRAEHYVELALVYERHLEDSDRAHHVLDAGVENEAEPVGLLQHHLEDLGSSGPHRWSVATRSEASR